MICNKTNIKKERKKTFGRLAYELENSHKTLSTLWSSNSPVTLRMTQGRPNLYQYVKLNGSYHAEFQEPDAMASTEHQH